jgi:uncharacterized membrane protein
MKRHYGRRPAPVKESPGRVAIANLFADDGPMFDTYNILKALHVLLAVTWVGGAIVINILGTRLSKADNPVALAAFAKETEVIGMKVFLPSSILILGLGIWMVAISGWSFTDLWVIIGIVGIVATAVTGATVLGPRAKKVGEAIEARGMDAEVEKDIVAILAVSRVDLVVLVIVVLDMVLKPGA